MTNTCEIEIDNLQPLEFILNARRVAFWDYRFATNYPIPPINVVKLPLQDRMGILDGHNRTRVLHDRGKETILARLIDENDWKLFEEAYEKGVRHVKDIDIVSNTEWIKEYGGKEEDSIEFLPDKEYNKRFPDIAPFVRKL